MAKDNHAFTDGMYITTTKTRYGEIINIKIDLEKLNRNLKLKDENGRECIYTQLLTNRDGGRYAIMNEYKYKHLIEEDDKPPFQTTI